MLIVGVSMTALSMSMIHNVKSTQHKQAAVHASSRAQPLAWAGAETFRHYLGTLDDDAIEALKPNNKKIAIDLSSTKNSNIEIYSTLLNTPQKVVDGAFEYYEVIAAISAFDRDAESSMTLKAVYHVTPTGGGSCSDCETLTATLDFYDDLNLSGDINIDGSSGQPATFNVDGSVTATSISLQSINYLNATGNITIGANTFIDEIYANGEITISGAAGVTKASSLTRITMGDGTRAEQIFTNGDIVLSGVATASVSLDALGSIYNDSLNNQGIATAGGDILSTPLAANMTQANAVGSIDVAYGSHSIGILRAQGNISCPSTTWSGYTQITTQASAINCPPANVAEGVPVAIDLMSTLVPFEMHRPVINVNTLRDYANYIFTAEGNVIRVFVRNINGIDDGNYYLGDYPFNGRGFHDFLCKELDANGLCINPASPNDTKTICHGYSTSNPCLTYNEDENSFNFGGRSSVPGVMFFEGNLELGDGIYYNSFLVTENITTTSQHQTRALNFADYGSICLLDYPINKNLTGDFDELYPTNLCDISEGSMTYNAIGNIAMAAGSTDDTDNHIGGTISLGANNDIGGTILAGNYLITHGGTTVHGYVSAAAQNRSGGENSLGGNTTIQINNLPENYHPNEIPPMTTPTNSDDDGKGNSAKGRSKLVWIKHL